VTTKQTSPSFARISDKELNRRWQAVRAGMKERGLDFLIFQNGSVNLPGYVKWFTDISFSGIISPITVIFPREEEMTVIRRGLRPARELPLTPGLRGIKKLIQVPMFWLSLTYASTFDAEKAVAELSKYKNCRIGWVGLGFLSAAFYKYVTEHLPTAKFEDVTDMVDRLKALKSDEEISLIRETCKLEDEIFNYALTQVGPGVVDTEIREKILKKCKETGAEGAISVRTAPAGKAARFVPNAPPRVLRNGDQVTLLIETSSPTYYWGEISRTICIGRIPDRLQEQFELAQEATKVTLKLLKPGAKGSEFWEANNAFLRDRGFEEEARLYAHGQGYDIVERPCLDPDETMRIEPRMFLAVHPEVVSNEAFGWICDNYFLKENGELELFQKTPQKIFVV
jgi:Xaa-Pro aminopeptidase